MQSSTAGPHSGTPRHPQPTWASESQATGPCREDRDAGKVLPRMSCLEPFSGLPLCPKDGYNTCVQAQSY